MVREGMGREVYEKELERRAWEVMWVICCLLIGAGVMGVLFSLATNKYYLIVEILVTLGIGLLCLSILFVCKRIKRIKDEKKEIKKALEVLD